MPNVDVKAGHTYFYIARIEFDRDGDIVYRLVLGPCEGYVPNHKLSIETRYEDENVQKLYIADGENPIMSINVMQYNGTNINSLFTIPSVTFNKIIFDKFIPGSLRASTVQYSY
nr:MAG TPA: stabilization protein [Caudoviricetes sp.]